jgi:hypothetical protein
VAFNAHGIGEFDGGILVGASTPYFSVGHEAAEDLPLVDQWTAVVDGHVSQPDALHYMGLLTWPR